MMLRNKTIDRLCCAALAAMLILTAVIWTGKSSAGRRETNVVGYEDLFDRAEVHTIDIVIEDWDGFIASATQETYVDCDGVIDGDKISNVGIRGKGNTSLSSVSSMGSEKYSFKIEFDQFVKGKTYHGLDKLSLNNLIYDATMMKDYLAYTLMARAGVPAPMCSFAQITVNGEPWGLYLAVEGVEDGFMERNNMTTGELYKPDSMSFGGERGNGRDFDLDRFRVKDEDGSDTSETDTDPGAGTSDASDPSGAFPFGSGMPGGMDFSGGGRMPGGMDLPEGFQMPEGMSDPGAARDQDGTNGERSSPSGGGEGFFRFGGGMFNFGMGSGDVKLQYIDDDPDSYSNIFNNAKTDIGKKDKTRLIRALKTLNSDDARDVVFADEVIRYLAVHDFMQNSDSYTGTMVHNYYLYEEDGRLAIIPWDYNLAFGGMGGGDASSAVNSPIDTPVSNSAVSDRPLISWIFRDEEALAAYHEAYDRFITDTVESGWLAGEISRVAEMIRPYVEADENSFYSAEEFQTAVETLQSYCALRGESVRGQLDGTIPSTSEEQRADSSALVDIGDLDISSMGSMNGGGPAGGGGFRMPSGFPDGTTGGSPQMPSGFPGATGGGFPQMPSARSDTTDAPAGTDLPAAEETASPSGNEAPGPGTSRERPEGFPGGGDFPGGGLTGPAQSGRGSGWIWFAGCLAALLAAVLIIRRMRGHND